jgi:hypothetical protein
MNALLNDGNIKPQPINAPQYSRSDGGSDGRAPPLLGKGKSDYGRETDGTATDH